MEFETGPTWLTEEPGVLNLVGTKFDIVHIKWSRNPFHVHGHGNCHGSFTSLAQAKKATIVCVGELVEMGMEP